MEENRKLEQGFDAPAAELSEESKKVLQSETWEKVRKVMKTEVQHFTNAPEIQHFAVEKVSKNDNVYGVAWGNVVREYLKTAYSGENAQAEVVSFGTTYKVLKRESVTAFYDVDGNTLFDVENTRLEKEYAWVMKEEAEHMSEDNAEPVTPMGKTIADIERQAFESALSDENGEVTESEQEQEEDTIPEDKEPPADNVSEDVSAPIADKAEKQESPEEIKERAKKKLGEELKKAKDKTFADPIINYLLERCGEDVGLSADILQEHKTWEKCFDYIFSQARKQAKGTCAAVRDDVVYEWAEDYYHKDDKAEEEKKAKKEAKAKAKREKAAAERKTQAKEKSSSVAASAIPKKEDKRKDQVKKNSKDMEGQLDMFSMMGM